MTLDKAIEILRHPPFYPSTPSDIDYDDAIKLGIEAMKRIKRQRGNIIPINQPPLLGEDIT